MSHREFERSSMQQGDKRVSCYRVTCSCGASHPIAVNTFSGNRPVEDLNRKFQQAGWAIGSKPSGDRCPECIAADRRRKNPPLKLVESPVQPASAPRQMTNEDRFLITTKLIEVHQGPGGRYKPGWTDAKLAEDLNVPRAWVAEVRKGMGMEEGNEEIVATVTEARALLAEAKAALADAQKAAAVAQGLAHKVDRIEKAVIAIEGALR
jgi:hypothetical protein